MVKNKLPLLGFIVFASINAQAQTLKDALQHALISNPEVLFNRAKTKATEKGVFEAKGRYYPSIDVKLGLGREKTNNPITNAIGGASSNRPMTRKESSIEVTQNLFAGYGDYGEIKRNTHLWHAQALKTVGIAEDLSLDVTETFLEVLKQQQLLMLARENLSRHEYVYHMIQKRTTAGVSRQAELQQAKGRLALANANYLSIENDLRDNRISFQRIVGEVPHHLSWPRTPSAKDLPSSLANAIQMGLENHPTLKSAHADIREAKAQHLVARANDYPRLDLLLRAAQNRNLDGLVGQNNEQLAIVRLSYNIFRGGSDLAKKQKTAYQVQEAYEVRNKTILELKEKTRLSWYAWITAGHRLEYLRSHVESARETREAYGEQFKVGKRTLLDLLDSQNEYYQAQIEETKGHFDEVYARYRILNSIGSLLPFLQGRLPIAVHNNDLHTSHEVIHHIGLNRPLQNTPLVEMHDKPLKAPPKDKLKHPAIHKHDIYKTTTTHVDTANTTWYIYAKKCFSQTEASKVAKKLQRHAMKARVAKTKTAYWVYLGPYTYRSEAGLMLKTLYKRLKLKGSLVALKHHYPRVQKAHKK